MINFDTTGFGYDVEEERPSISIKNYNDYARPMPGTIGHDDDIANTMFVIYDRDGNVTYRTRPEALIVEWLSEVVTEREVTVKLGRGGLLDQRIEYDADELVAIAQAERRVQTALEEGEGYSAFV